MSRVPSLQDLASRKIDAIFSMEELERAKEILGSGQATFSEILNSKGVPYTAISRVIGDKILFVSVEPQGTIINRPPQPGTIRFIDWDEEDEEDEEEEAPTPAPVPRRGRQAPQAAYSIPTLKLVVKLFYQESFYEFICSRSPCPGCTWGRRENDSILSFRQVQWDIDYINIISYGKITVIKNQTQKPLRPMIRLMESFVDNIQIPPGKVSGDMYNTKGPYAPGIKTKIGNSNRVTYQTVLDILESEIEFDVDPGSVGRHDVRELVYDATEGIVAFLPIKVQEKHMNQLVRNMLLEYGQEHVLLDYY